MSERKEKFTPGPWALEPKYKEWVYSASPNAGAEDLICDAPENDADYAPWVANAHLIAAAPELYEALAGLFESYKRLADSGDAGFWKIENTDEGKQAMSALAKARGEA